MQRNYMAQQLAIGVFNEILARSKASHCLFEKEMYLLLGYENLKRYGDSLIPSGIELKIFRRKGKNFIQLVDIESNRVLCQNFNGRIPPCPTETESVQRNLPTKKRKSSSVFIDNTPRPNNSSNFEIPGSPLNNHITNNVSDNHTTIAPDDDKARKEVVADFELFAKCIWYKTYNRKLKALGYNNLNEFIEGLNAMGLRLETSRTKTKETILLIDIATKKVLATSDRRINQQKKRGNSLASCQQTKRYKREQVQTQGFTAQISDLPGATHFINDSLPEVFPDYKLIVEDENQLTTNLNVSSLYASEESANNGVRDNANITQSHEVQQSAAVVGDSIHNEPVTTQNMEATDELSRLFDIPIEQFVVNNEPFYLFEEVAINGEPTNDTDWLVLEQELPKTGGLSFWDNNRAQSPIQDDTNFDEFLKKFG